MSKNCKNDIFKNLHFFQKMTIFGNFFEKKCRFWQFFDIQMSIFQRVNCPPFLPSSAVLTLLAVLPVLPCVAGDQDWTYTELSHDEENLTFVGKICVKHNFATTCGWRMRLDFKPAIAGLEVSTSSHIVV